MDKKIRVQLKISAKGNHYISLTYYNNGYNACSLALFTSLNFDSQRIHKTTGIKNLLRNFKREISNYLESQDNFYEKAQEKLEDENLELTFMDVPHLKFIITDIAKVYGINVQADGCYIEYDGKIYDMPKYLIIQD